MNAATPYIDPEVQALRTLYEDLLSSNFYAWPITIQLEKLAVRLWESHRAQKDAVCFQIKSWHPALQSKDDAQILQSAFNLDDARITIAREFGFLTWDKVLCLAQKTSDIEFELAVDIMLNGDLDTLKQLLHASPDLTARRSSYGHAASLLHYLGNNGIESYRQIVPRNIVDVIELLLASGADPASLANIYGGSTPLELFLTSKHTQLSGVISAGHAIFNKYMA
jgi:ankyrin repeat protein